MKNKILFLSLVILSSCVTQKKREKICRTCTIKEVTTVDTVRTEVVRVDTLIFTTENPCKEMCDSIGNLKPFSRDIKNDKGKVVVLYSKANNLHVKEEDKVRIETKTIYKNISKEVPSRCEKEHITKWKSFLIVSGYIFWIILVLFVGYKAVKTAKIL